MRDYIYNLIKKAEKIAEIDLIYYFKNSGFLILLWAVTVFAGIAISLIFPRLLDKTIYGQWSFVLSVMGILATFNLPGMKESIIRSVSHGNDGILGVVTLEKIKWGSTGSLLLILLSLYYFYYGNYLLFSSFIAAAMFFPFYENFQTFIPFLAGKLKFKVISFYQSIIVVFSTSITIIFVLYSKNLALIIFVYLASLSMLGFFFFKKSYKLKENNKKNDLKETISLGKHFTAQNVPGQLTAWGDRILIGLLLGFPALAIYTVSKSYSQLLISLLKPIIDVSLPKLSEMDEKNAFDAVKKKYFSFFFLNALLCILAILMAPILIPILFTSNYSDSILYSQIIIIALIFGTPTSIIINGLFPAQKKVKELYKIHIFLAIVEFSVLIPLLFIYGILGVVIAKIVSNLMTMVYSWYLSFNADL